MKINMFYALGDDKFTAYKGKVIGFEKYISTSVEGKVTHSVFTGKDFNISSSSSLIIKAKVLLFSGRIKEFYPHGFEVQEGDDIEFILTDSDCNIYLNNITTGKSEIVKPTYMRPEFLSWAGVAFIVAIFYGFYKIKSAHNFLASFTGFGVIGVSLIAVTLLVVIFKKRIAELNAKFQTKVLATGVNVGEFKNPDLL